MTLVEAIAEVNVRRLTGEDCTALDRDITAGEVSFDLDAQEYDPDRAAYARMIGDFQVYT